MDLQHSGSPLPGFIFPVLKLDEIVKCISELDRDLDPSISELQEPAHHKEKLRRIFMSLLEVCTGKTEEDFQPTPAMLARAKTMPHPELHQEYSELLFYTALRDLLTTSGYASFSWRDLHAPTSHRLRYQLSAVINLAKFREEQLKVYAELMAPRAMIVHEYQSVHVENEQLNERLEQVEYEAAAKFREMDGIVRECEELALEIARNNKLQAAAREEGDVLKKQATDLKDQVATATWALQEAEAEEEKLRSLVVSSPDRRKQELYVRQEALRKIKDESATLEQQVQDCKAMVVNAMQCLQDLDAANSILDDLTERINKYTELTRKVDDARKQLQGTDKTTDAVLKQIEEAERQLARSEEKIVHQRKQHQLQLDAAQDALEMAKTQLLRVEKDRREGLARVEAGEAHVRALEAALEDERIVADAERHGLVAQYQRVEAAFLERHQEQMGALLRAGVAGGSN